MDTKGTKSCVRHTETAGLKKIYITRLLQLTNDTNFFRFDTKWMIYECPKKKSNGDYYLKINSLLNLYDQISRDL